jgi:hypothetical protein
MELGRKADIGRAWCHQGVFGIRMFLRFLIILLFDLQLLSCSVFASSFELYLIPSSAPPAPSSSQPSSWTTGHTITPWWNDRARGRVLRLAPPTLEKEEVEFTR